MPRRGAALAAAGWLFAGLAVVGQCGRFSMAADAVNGFMPLVLVAALAVLGGAVLARTRVAAGGAIAALVLGGVPFAAAVREGGAPVAGAGPMIAVLSFSTFHANPDPAAIKALVEAARPDLVALQETDGTAAPVVPGVLPAYHRIGSCTAAACSLTLLSRWPLVRVADVARTRGPLPDLLAADVATPWGPVRVVDLHLPRPTHPAAALFRADLHRLALRSRALPLLIAGDFNMATGETGLQALIAGTGLRRADRFLPTWPADAPVPAFLAIDHVLFGPAFGPEGCRRLGAARSDHRAILCRFRLGAGGVSLSAASGSAPDPRRPPR